MLRIVFWTIMIFGGSVFGYYIDSLMFENVHNNIISHVVSLLFGVFLLFIVMRISKNTGRTLAKYGRKGKLKRMQTNILTRQGVYKYMRHPMHLGLLFLPLAVAFLIGSPSFILIIAPVEIIFMLIMIKYVEEPDTIKKFGDEYLEYKKQVPWFCFKMKCLKKLLENVPKNYVK
ncbi:MAG: isoprenylcysteine carboxylmethyltransferase family protein [Bacteroidota bacterium]|nr:isoprenylcysteine carboxylmethyltransferase family protein [Bacteroidota bacterium]